MQLMRISLVLIAWMLIPSAASNENIFAATPAWERIPRPTMDTLTTSGSNSTDVAPIELA